MSTNDVPGAKAANNDALAMGCWAEHDDGSMIFVEGVEAGKVVYSIFDLATDPPVEYRDSMVEHGFKTQFTWDPKAQSTKSLKWTWHDKTPFPWDTVMQDFSPGQRHGSAVATISAAARVAESLRLKAGDVVERQNVTPQRQRDVRTVLETIQKAIEALDED
jgi:hypothetical protein